MKTANIPVHGVYKLFRCLSKNRLYTKMLRIHLFSIVIIKTPRTLAAIVLLRILNVKTLKIVLLLLHTLYKELFALTDSLYQSYLSIFES